MERLQKEVRNILRNRLTYPKTILGVCRERVLNEEQVSKAKTCIDECLQLIDSKFIELRDELEAKQ